MRYTHTFEIPDDTASEHVEAVIHAAEVALQQHSNALVLPVPEGFPMERMPLLAAEFVRRLQEASLAAAVEEA